MNVIVPRPVTLISSNVPNGPHPPWSSAVTYSVSDRVYDDSTTPHRIYESLLNSNNGKTPPEHPDSWVEVGSTTRWAMLDTMVSSTTTNLDTISVTLNASKVDRIALFGLVGESVRIVARNGATVIEDTTLSLRLDDQSVSWSDYFFSDIEYRTRLIRTIPGYYANLEIDITITAATGTEAACGHCILGRSQFIGLTEWGAKVGIDDYSRKTINDWGETYLQQRAYADTLSIDLWIDTQTSGAEVDRLQRILSSLRATPCVWDANNDTERQALIVFGFFRDFSLVVPYATISHCSLEIEGMI